jgi:hypothetical protein
MNSKVDYEIKNIMFNSLEDDGFFKALELKYGKVVPLYHATDFESYQLIQTEGLKIMEGSNYLNWGYSKQLYFQIGKSDYVDNYRSILLRFNASIDWLSNFCFADLDNVTVNDKDLLEYGVNLNQISSEMKDFLKYYIWNEFNIDGMEIIIKENYIDEIGKIFPERIL